MDIVSLVLIAIWVMLPAYIPNNVAVLAGGGRPIDGGHRWRGKRILGDGKTWRGTAAGIAVGILVALGLNTIHPSMRSLVGISLPTFTGGIVLGFPAGAMLGDISASFLKRRVGKARGSAFPLLDQLDFVVFALLVGLIGDPEWMLDVFDLRLILVVLLITPILHLATNIIAYVLGLKDEPW